MGIVRKAASIATFGVVKFRNETEQLEQVDEEFAASNRKSKKLAKKADKLAAKAGAAEARAKRAKGDADRQSRRARRKAKTATEAPVEEASTD